nr:hypothetical protein [Tanacetum cinerariifolium]
MPIPGNLITADIQGKPYYQEYLEKVAKHQRYLAGEQGSDPDSPAPKPAKATKKSKPSMPKVDLRPPVIKPTSSQQLEPKPAPAKSKGKKHKEPRVDDEEADVQRALEESLKSFYDAPRGSLPPVVVREPESGISIASRGMPKKKSPAAQSIFQRPTSTPTSSSCHDESSLLYAELGLTDSEVEYDEDVSRIDVGVQGEGQAGPNPNKQDEGQDGPNLGDAVASQPQSSPVVHAGPTLEHIDLEVTDVSTQPHPEQMDKWFTATAYPKIQENLKLTVKEHVILEEPASSTGTLSSLQYLTKDLSFGDLFFNDKPSKADNEKTTTETEAESMVYVIIQQDTFVIPPMTTPIVNLTLRPDSPNVHQPLQATIIKTTTTTTIHPPPPQPQQSTINFMLMKCIALKKSMNCDHSKELLKDLAESRKKKKNRRDSPKTPPGSPPHQSPPPPPPPALSSLKTAASAEYKAWTKTDTRLKLSVSSTPKDLQMDDDMAPDAQAHSSDDEDIRNAHISNYQIEECHKLLADSVDDSIIRHNVRKPLPMGGPPGQVTIQYDFFFNKDLEYLRYDSKGSKPALSISKLKAAYYLDVGLEQMVPDQMWIEEECKNTYEGDRKAVRTHMRILSVVRIEVFSMYGYDYIKKIVLRRADVDEHIIAKRDFKYLYPSDFEDLYLLHLQGHLNHLPPKDKKILTTTVNLWTRHLVIRQRDRYRVQMIMRFNEIHKFNDSTLHQIDEALDYWVKEFKKRLKTRRIFRNLKSFVGGRVRDGDYRLFKRTE